MYRDIAKDGIVIVGSGVAGLVTALRLAQVHDTQVTVITATALDGACASRWSQGGIAAAVGPGDSPEQHAADTIRVAGGIADEDAVRSICAAAPDAIAMLDAWGVGFDRNADGTYLQSREGGHAHNRVLRATGDSFGRALMGALVAQVRNTPSIRVLEKHAVTDLHNAGDEAGADITGISVMRLADKYRTYIPVNAVVLATGGAGRLYNVTTNPAGATAQGVAMAARAGARISDFEFVQFHPTAIACDADPAPLATEALRGEGAVLVNDAGIRFMEGVHTLAELAPRDVVARAIFDELQAGRRVFLDATQAVGDAFPGEFPTVFNACMDAGIDPRIQPIPVMPAAHYHMGGVASDYRTGATNVNGLYVAGEAAATGLHGANRLASNSLLEGVVMGSRIAAHLAAQNIAGRTDAPRKLAPYASGDTALEAALEADLRKTMHTQVGVAREGALLDAAIRSFAGIEKAATTSRLRDMAIAARLIATSAFQRTESRGGHYRADCPAADSAQAQRSFTDLSAANAMLADMIKTRRSA